MYESEFLNFFLEKIKSVNNLIWKMFEFQKCSKFEKSSDFKNCGKTWEFQVWKSLKKTN
jgi:threonyl-tRNA synthetase